MPTHSGEEAAQVETLIRAEQGETACVPHVIYRLIESASSFGLDHVIIITARGLCLTVPVLRECSPGTQVWSAGRSRLELIWEGTQCVCVSVCLSV